MLLRIVTAAESEAIEMEKMKTPNGFQLNL